MIKNYHDFCAELRKAGFSIFGGNGEEIYGLIKYDWREEPTDYPLRWHTGDSETDPWEWRIRVVTEEKDIAYGKIFFRKGGFITKEWYPHFLAARRQGKSFEEEYEEGLISHFAKRIYQVFDRIIDLDEGEQKSGVTFYEGMQKPELAFHEIKQLIGVSKEDAGKFERAIVELQMKLYLTVSGEKQKTTETGEGYGWPSMVYSTTETFWGEEVFDEAAALRREDAIDEITEQILQLNPGAEQKKIRKFICG